ncbi:MAG TPA: peptidoglycan-binding domain-containing protein [Baekduia sp.]|nr:peptidoglycan-binding domain-containing protein [Baekduia sp.]
MIAVVALIGLAVVGWVAAGQIKSPARVAAETAPPPASPITVPVARRALSTEVIVRGTVRYGAPQPVALATSKLKQGSDLVTRAPRSRARLRPGATVMEVDGRPVFVMAGDVPMHRDLRPGDKGPDVHQLEAGLAALGFTPGDVDGTFDKATETAVTAFYLSRGRDPFGPTDADQEALRSAEASAASARDAWLQAVHAVEQGARPVAPGEVTQARLDAVTARDAYHTAALGVAAARARVAAAKALAGSTKPAEALAVANQRREQALADAEVANKRHALTQAIDEEKLARMRRDEVSTEAPPSEREAANQAVRQAAENVQRAKAELDAAVAAAEAVRAGAGNVAQKGREEATNAARDVRLAEAELRRALQAVATTRTSARLAALKATQLAKPGDTRTLRRIADSAGQEARRTAREVDRLLARSGVSVPADELLFLPSLPLRVDAVKARRGDVLNGAVMDVTSSRLVIDSSLSVSDAKLVRPGNRVAIGEDELGVRSSGVVSQVADRPGTRGADATRFHFSVSPTAPLMGLVGASVKLTIAVTSTDGEVLAVPASALSVGGDGTSRVQVRRGGRTEIVPVVPGLAAQGLVEVRPAGAASLREGDLVIVGSGRRAAAAGP